VQLATGYLIQDSSTLTHLCCVKKGIVETGVSCSPYGCGMCTSNPECGYSLTQACASPSAGDVCFPMSTCYEVGATSDINAGLLVSTSKYDGHAAYANGPIATVEAVGPDKRSTYFSLPSGDLIAAFEVTSSIDSAQYGCTTRGSYQSSTCTIYRGCGTIIATDYFYDTANHCYTYCYGLNN
jgi:hypothetical protein